MREKYCFTILATVNPSLPASDNELDSGRMKKKIKHAMKYIYVLSFKVSLKSL